MAKQICNLEQVLASLVSVHFGLVSNEMQSFLPTETDARRNHDVNENLQVAVDYSVQNWKCGIEYLYSYNFGENTNIFLKISEL